MCSPIASPFTAAALRTLSLDALAVLAAQQPTPAVQDAFARALLKWTRARVQRLTVRYASLDTPEARDDLCQEFLLRCLTRHLPRWQPGSCLFTAYAWRRLHGDVIDTLRTTIRETRRQGDEDELAPVTDDEHSHEGIAEAKRQEGTLRLLAGGLQKLPVDDCQLLVRSAHGESMTVIAAERGVHPSTLSRRRAQALVALRAEVQTLMAA